MELHNSAGESALEEGLRAQFERAFSQELRGPLPPRLTAAHARGFADYFSTARHAATSAAARRKRRSEGGGLGPDPGDRGARPAVRPEPDPGITAPGPWSA